MSRKLIVSAVTAAALAGATLAAPAVQAAPARGATKVHASAKHTVTAPRAIRPGMVHLQNTGTRAILVIGKKKAGVNDLVKYLNAQDEKTAKKAFTKFDFVELLLPRSDDFVALKRGTYYLADGSGDSIKASKVRTLSVSGKTSDARRPASRGVTYDKRGLRPVTSKGRIASYLRVRNTAANPVLVEFVKVLPKTTAKQVSAFLAKPDYETLGTISDTAHFVFAAFVGGHHDIAVRRAIHSGRYLVLAVDAFTHASGIRRGDAALVSAG